MFPRGPETTRRPADPERPMTALPRPLALVVCLAALAVPAHAQLAEGGARTLGLGRAGVALGGEAWGHTNPAARASLAEGRAGVQASQAFGLGELRMGALAAALPTALGAVGLEARTYGFSERSETRVRVGLARAVPLSRSRRLDVGIALGVESAATAGFETETALLLDIGVQGQVLPGLRAGLAGRNLTGLGRSDDDDGRLSASTVPGLTVGVAYRPSDLALVVVDADQDLDFGLSVRAGVEVTPVEALALRAGVSTRPTRFSGGVGVRAGPLRADLAVEVHEVLGVTPAVGVEVGF